MPVEAIIPLSMRTLFWLFLGYAVIWGGIILFVMNMRRRQDVLERQIAEVEKALSSKPHD